MSPRATNLALFALSPALVLTGLIAWVLPDSAAGPLLSLHRALAASLIVSLAWKEGIARRSIRRRAASRRWSSLALGTLTSAVLLVTLGLGLAWTVGLVSFDRPFAYSLLNVHVFAGIALVPLVVAHAAGRQGRAPVRARLGRRDALRGFGALAAGVLLAAGLDRVDASRGATGSRAAAGLPVTSWTFDRVPAVDATAWRLDVGGRSLSAAQLLAMPWVEQDVTLDCTGGWASTHRWRGVPVAALVGDDRSVRVTSVTGHAASFVKDDLAGLLLATHLDGTPLSAEHGAPARLVAPTHRGFMWVKWVARVEVI